LTEPTPATVEQVLKNLAPWPMGADATPARLARWFTARAFASFAALHGHPCWKNTPEYDANGKPSGAYQEGLRAFAQTLELAWAQYTSAYLLRVQAGQPVDLPLDDALRREEDSGEEAADTVAVWLDGYGIDPEQILTAMRGPAVVRPRKTGGAA